MTSSSADAPVALITGANRGIGAATVAALAAEGWTVVAASRQSAWVEQAPRNGVIPLLLDVTSDESIEAAHAELVQRLGGRGLDLLVNNAGVLVEGPVQLLPRDEIRRQYEVNVFGAMAVTRIFLPLLTQARGRVISLGSVTGRTSVPFWGASASSKAALASFCDALRMEVRPFGVSVCLIEPPPVATRIFAEGSRAADSAMRDADPRVQALYAPAIHAVRRWVAKGRPLPAEAVAAGIVRAATARRPRTRYLIGRQARVLAALRFLPTRLREHLIRRDLGLTSLPPA